MKNGNLLGEPFEPYVLTQINQRQKIQYSGKEKNRTNPEINYLNNRNAWVKLASGVNVSGSFGDDRLRTIGFNNTELAEFRDSNLAKHAILFNGMSSLTPEGSYIFRHGTKSNVRYSGSNNTNEYLWTDDTAYGLGSVGFGQQPMPGIIDVNIQAVNRGSIRKATVTLKAHNKFQFELIELLYLRLGYSMLIEWGWDKYLDDKGNIETMGNTLSEGYWFNSPNQTQSQVLEKIESLRINYCGNYDAFFGKVTNFEWNLGSDMVYNITLHLVTVGDVIESLKVNKPIRYKNSPNNNIVNAIDVTDWNNADLKDSNIIKYANDNVISNWLYKKIHSYENFRTPIDFYRYLSYTKDAHLNYYIRLERLLLEIQDQVVESIITGNTSEKIIGIDTDVDNTLIYLKPFQYSTNPKICIFNIKGIFPTTKTSIYKGVLDFDYFTEPNLVYPTDVLPEFISTSTSLGNEGKLMNLYMNFDFIVQILFNSKDKDGNVSMYKFLEALCQGINSSFCNTTKLEPIIKDDRIITLIDQNSIPQVFEKKVEDEIVLYGYDIKRSNFVRNINFNTKLSPKTASLISIGATAGKSSSTILDGTLFSKWNIGLEDRFKSSIIENPPEEEINTDSSRIEKWQKEIALAWRDAIIDPFTFGKDLKKNPKFRDKEYSGVKEHEFHTIAFNLLQSWHDQDLAERNRIANLDITEDYILYSQNLFSSLIKPSLKDGAYYFNYEDQTIKESKARFNQYVNYESNKYFQSQGESSNTIGFIPLVLSLDLEGISGIKIYQRLNLAQKVLPYQYNDSFQFLITQVNHKIENNDWVTSLSTITNSNLQNLQSLERITKEEPTPIQPTPLLPEQPTPIGITPKGPEADYWSLVAVCAGEGYPIENPQGTADIAQSIYNRMAAKYYKTLRKLLFTGQEYEITYKNKRRDLFKAIKDKESAIKAYQYCVNGRSYEAAKKGIEAADSAINNPTLQMNARSFVWTRTEFLANPPTASTQRMVVERTPKRTNNVFYFDSRYFGWGWSGKGSSVIPPAPRCVVKPQ
jgi:hypothetical protein